MIVDTHTHLFALDSQRYPLADPTASYRPLTDGSVELLKREMDEAGVDRAVTISPWPYRWDMRYVLDVLQSHRSWLAVAVLIDPRSPDGPERLTRYVKQNGVSGLRIHGRAMNLGPYDDPATTPLWAAAAELGIALDACAALDEYACLARRAEQFPGLPIILDHCGYIAPGIDPVEPDLGPVLALARYPNVYAKLTFLGSASKQEYPFRDVHWMVRQIVDAFGAERSMAGSNFPTAQYNRKCCYAQTTRLFQEEIDLTNREREWILGKTALKLWRWG
ncbi:MAG TPA: amidohydrolase family protein [Chloroflexota bacterium]|nr:amidohydrolase family protein [Chloroflexota bacterium]